MAAGDFEQAGTLPEFADGEHGTSGRLLWRAFRGIGSGGGASRVGEVGISRGLSAYFAPDADDSESDNPEPVPAGEGEVFHEGAPGGGGGPEIVHAGVVEFRDLGAGFAVDDDGVEGVAGGVVVAGSGDGGGGFGGEFSVGDWHSWV